MKKVQIIFGNITLLDVEAIIHEVNDVLHIDRDKADEVGESLVNLYDAYLIPSEYSGKISWDKGVKKELRIKIVK